MPPTEDLKNLILTIRNFFEPTFKAIDDKLASIDESLNKYIDELYIKVNKVQERIIKVEERQVGWNRCIGLREDCKAKNKIAIDDTKEEILKHIEEHEIIQWVKRARRRADYIILTLIVSSTLSIIAWLLYIFKIH